MLLNSRTFGCVHFVFILVWLTNVDARFKYSVSNWRGGCNDGDDGGDNLLTIRNIPLQKCLLESHIRQRCNAVKYLVTSRECRLLENTDNMNSVYIKRPCIFIRMTDVEVMSSVPDVCQKCSVNQVCNEQTKRCDSKECEHVSVVHADVFGNLQSIGSKVKVVPHQGYTLGQYTGISMCQANGKWDIVPKAEIVDCGDPPNVPNAYVSSNESLKSQKLYKCNEGYEARESDADMRVSCLSNGVWSNIGFKCKEVQSTVCDGNWFMHNQSCYIELQGLKASFVDANVECSQLHAHLVHIETEAENEAMFSYLMDTYGKSKGWWIGMKYSCHESTWKFSRSHINVSFFNWAPDERVNLNQGQHCAMTSYDGYWADHKCFKQENILCEKAYSESSATRNDDY